MYMVSSAGSCRMLTIKIVNNALNSLIFIIHEFLILIKHLIVPNYCTVSYLKTGASMTPMQVHQFLEQNFIRAFLFF